MIIILYGPNKYLLKEKLRAIIARYQQKHQGLDLRRLDAEQTEFADFWDSFRQKSMLVQRRLTVVDNLFQGEDFKKEFGRRLKELAADPEVVVAWATEAPKKADRILVEKAKKLGQVQEFPRPGRAETRKWVSSLAAEQGLSLSAEALEELIRYIGDDWQKGRRALTRLATADQKEDVLAELGKMEQSMESVDVFRLTAAISRGFKDKALMAAHRYFAQGGRPEKLLPLTAYQFRQLMIVRDLIDRGADYQQARRLSGLPGFVFRQVYLQAEKTTLERLKKIYRHLFELDRKIKTGQIDFRTGFDLFIAKV